MDRDVQVRVTKQLQVLGKERVDPLLLAMVLESGKTDSIDDNRASLYEKFLRRKLKLEPNDQISWDGLRSAFEVIAEYSLLRSGNRGHGLSYDALMDVIEAEHGPEATGKPLLERLEKRFHLNFKDPAAFVKRAASDGYWRAEDDGGLRMTRSKHISPRAASYLFLRTRSNRQRRGTLHYLAIG